MIVVNPYRFANNKLLLDEYSGGVHGYSMRKLRKDYAGACLRVRRDSDNTKQDIGFDADGNLDTAALSSFVGANSGFVTDWYNQAEYSSNYALKIANTSQQPRIVNAGTIHTRGGNSRPAMVTTASNSRLVHGSGYADPIFGTNGDITGFICSGEPGVSTTDALIRSNVNGQCYHFQLSSATNMRFRHDNGTIANFTISNLAGNPETFLFSMFHDNSLNLVALWIDGTSQGTATMTNEWGNDAAEYRFHLDPGASGISYQEIIYFDGDQSANRSAIETNINNYFGAF